MIRFSNDSAKEFMNGKYDEAAALAALKTLKTGSGAGSEYTDWLKLPYVPDKDEYERIKKLGAKIYEDAEALVVIGIGGSYLGARAAVEFLLTQRFNETGRKGPKLYFLGNGVNSNDLTQVLELVKGKKLYVNVISKSGTTLEPALAFRIFRQYLEETVGPEEAKKRISCTTDKARGVLKGIADAQGYETFVIPDGVGGRYSVLTPVGLLPMAAMGIDIDKIIAGAREQMEENLRESADNSALIYAASRQALYANGKKVEIISCPGESTRFIAEWCKQLYGESEGKEGKGLFPASCVYTADLHSMGQYIQEGERILCESFLRIAQEGSYPAPSSESDDDKLNYLTGKTYADIYAAAAEGVKRAHVSGGVPCMEIFLDKQDEEHLGRLFVFFEVTCGISGYMMGVNPFNQPGVEAYKSNMFELLGKK